MKKFTLLIALLVCTVGFSQQESSFSSWADNNPNYTQEQNVPVKATTQNRNVYPSVDLRGVQSTSIEELLSRLSEIGNSTGNISDYFTPNEQQILRNHFANQNVRATPINYSSVLSGTILGSSRFLSADPNVILTEGPRPQGISSNTSNTNTRNVVTTLTYNTDNVITGTNSVACGGGDNFSARLFLLDTDFGITTEFTITDGEIGVQSVDTTFDVIVNVIAADASFPTGYPGAGTLLGSEVVTIPLGSDLSIVNYTFTTPVVVPAGTQFLVVEVVQALDGVQYWVGGTVGETADSWLASVNCGLPEYGTTTSIGFPDAHYYITVTGDTAGGGGGGGPVVAHGWESQGLGYGNLDPQDPTVYNTVSPGSGTANFESSGAIDPNDTTTGYVMDNAGEVWSVNVATGVYTSMGNNGVLDAVGLEFNPVDGVLYMNTTTSLYTIDTGTGAATLVGALGTGGGLAIALAIDGAGNAWTYDIVDDSFYSVNLGTGAATFVGGIGFDANFGQGMAWDPNTDQVYLAAFNNGIFDAEIRTVDTATGNTTLVGQFLVGTLNQLAWMSIPDAGGGGGGGCTAGVFTDRASFDAATAGGTMFLEDFGGGPAAIQGCNGPINNAGNDCYPPGEILPGIEVTNFDLANSPPTVSIPAGALGNTDPLVGPNFFTDYMILNFPDNDVNAFGIDLNFPLIAGSVDVDLRIFGTGGLIDTQTVTIPDPATVVFFGYIASEIIVSVEIEDALSAGEGELLTMAAFGMCSGGGGPFVCTGVDTTYDATGLPAEIDPGGTQTADCAGAPNLYPVNVSDAGTINVDASIQNVTINITHTWDGDLDISLVSPTGTELLLSGGNGGSGDDYINTVFMDGGADITGGTPPFTGTFQPQGGTFEAAFDGEDILGDWSLKICDNAGGDTGTVDSFSITICAPAPVGPPNDLCDNAIAVACGDSVTGTTVDATIDDAVAPTCDTGVTSPGVWYSFTDTSGLVSDITVTMCSGNGTADYDSKISVYTGDCAAPPLTCVVGNDDTCGLQSEVTFQSDGTSTYLILVHGFGGATGTFTIDINCVPIPPPNDDIINSIDVDELGCPFTDLGVAMPAATTEGGNPVGCNIDGANGVWYNITPEFPGFITATIEQPAGTSHVTFYTAPNENAIETDLVLVDYFDNQCVPGTTTTIPVVAGQAYYIFVVNTGGITDITIDCDLLGIDDITIEGFNYYPNPATEAINLSALDNIETVVIYSILGQKVIDLNVDAISTQIDVSSLSTGTYIMKVSVNGQIGTYKVLKK